MSRRTILCLLKDYNIKFKRKHSTKYKSCAAIGQNILPPQVKPKSSQNMSQTAVSIHLNLYLTGPKLDMNCPAQKTAN